jgi:biotin transport system substrate-specific component
VGEFNNREVVMKSSTTILELDEFIPALQRTSILPLLQVLCASLFIGLCAQIQIPLYFTPVPLTGQTFAVILIASTLSRRKAVLATMLYLMEGSLGLPVFAGGACGVHRLFGPTGGYLISYPLQAYFVSYFIEKQKVKNFFKTMAVLVSSCALQLGIGTLWLSNFVGSNHAFMMGFYPFALGEILKSLIVATYVKKTQTRR